MLINDMTSVAGISRPLPRHQAVFSLKIIIFFLSVNEEPFHGWRLGGLEGLWFILSGRGQRDREGLGVSGSLQVNWSFVRL